MDAVNGSINNVHMGQGLNWLACGAIRFSNYLKRAHWLLSSVRIDRTHKVLSLASSQLAMGPNFSLHAHNTHMHSNL